MITASERRDTERPKVLLAAVVEMSGKAIPARIVDVSAGGTLVLGPALAPTTPVVVRRGELAVSGQVVWAEPDRSGIRFERPLDVGSMLRTIKQPRPRTTACSRRPGLKCAPLSRAELGMLERWATAGAFALGD